MNVSSGTFDYATGIVVSFVSQGVPGSITVTPAPAARGITQKVAVMAVRAGGGSR